MFIPGFLQECIRFNVDFKRQQGRDVMKPLLVGVIKRGSCPIVLVMMTQIRKDSIHITIQVRQYEREKDQH